MTSVNDIKTWQERSKMREFILPAKAAPHMVAEISDLRTYAEQRDKRVGELEAELEEWRFTNKVDELQRECDRLRTQVSQPVGAVVDTWDVWGVAQRHDLGDITDSAGNLIASMYAKYARAVVDAHNNSLAALAAQTAAPGVKHYEEGRRQGRAEALAILMELEPETGIDEYTGWSTPVGPEDEGSAYWDEQKLRELFSADGALADMMDQAEAQYWQYIGMQGEAERAHNFAVNMHGSGKVREILAKAGEFDLMGQLCSAPAPAAPLDISGLTRWIPYTSDSGDDVSWESPDGRFVEYADVHALSGVTK